MPLAVTLDGEISHRFIQLYEGQLLTDQSKDNLFTGKPHAQDRFRCHHHSILVKSKKPCENN